MTMPTTAARRAVRATLVLLTLAGGAALSACGDASSTGSGNPQSNAAGSQTVHVDLVLKTDADSGAPGTFTGKEHWPAFAPTDLKVPANSTVVLTIKAYDSANTAFAAADSPWTQVKGGTETVDGTAVTAVSNDKIAHTFSVAALGINVPIPMAPDGGVTTVVFTFKTGAAGTYDFRCMTPCGGGDDGMAGSMATMGWMKGHLTVA